MPPKPKFTKDAVINTAYEGVRKKGEDFLTARSLASALNCSTAPIFTLFSGIEEVKQGVAKRAFSLYETFLEEGLSSPTPFKGAGLAYIRFAKEEPNLFRFLFMQGIENETPTNYFPGDKTTPEIERVAGEAYGLSQAQVKALYNHLSVYAHGLASLYAVGRCVFTLEDASRMLSEVFTAILKEIKGNA